MDSRTNRGLLNVVFWVFSEGLQYKSYEEYHSIIKFSSVTVILNVTGFQSIELLCDRSVPDLTVIFKHSTMTIPISKILKGN